VRRLYKSFIIKGLMCIGVNLKYLLFLSHLNRTLHLSTDFPTVLIKLGTHGGAAG
jgi:hypothetical protein